MNNGLDTAFDATAYVADIYSKGLAFVGRYYRMPTSSYPALGANEAKAITQAGLKIVSLFEYSSGSTGDISDFSPAIGVSHGQIVYAQAVQAGQPANTPIYFAVDWDFDITQSAYAQPIDAYFAGVLQGYQNAAGSSAPIYQIGAYGSGLVCGWLLGNKRITYAWLADSPGWTPSNKPITWNVMQSKGDGSINFNPGGKGSSFDFDQMNSNCGAWTYPLGVS
jgi:hypothetical protein